jgi:hypothetical protein
VLVGRAAELAMLRAAVDKSRLVADLADFTGSLGLPVLRGRAVDKAHRSRSGPLAEAFLAHCAMVRCTTGWVRAGGAATAVWRARCGERFVSGRGRW